MMAKRQPFSTSDAFNARRGLGTSSETETPPASGSTVSKCIRFPMEIWSPLEAELRARGLNASNGIRMICADWLRREQRR
jgi:hypothetical protein